MGRTGKSLGPIQFLKFGEVVEINRRMIQRYGGVFFKGDDNLVNPGSLEYIQEAIRVSFFGHTLYPTLIEKAAALAWQIITVHTFHDGNKRTGMEACRLMLDLNGYTMRIDADVVNVALQVAERYIAFSDFVRWLEQRTVETGR
jgi:death-on-curing protein